MVSLIRSIFILIALISIGLSSLDAKSKRVDPMDFMFQSQDPFVYSTKRHEALSEFCRQRKIPYMHGYERKKGNFCRFVGEEIHFKTVEELHAYVTQPNKKRTHVKVFLHADHPKRSHVINMLTNIKARIYKRIQIDILPIRPDTLDSMNQVFTYFDLQHHERVFVLLGPFGTMQGEHGTLLPELAQTLDDIYTGKRKPPVKPANDQPNPVAMTAFEIVMVGWRNTSDSARFVVVLIWLWLLPKAWFSLRALIMMNAGFWSLCWSLEAGVLWTFWRHFHDWPVMLNPLWIQITMAFFAVSVGIGVFPVGWRKLLGYIPKGSQVTRTQMLVFAGIWTALFSAVLSTALAWQGHLDFWRALQYQMQADGRFLLYASAHYFIVAILVVLSVLLYKHPLGTRLVYGLSRVPKWVFGIGVIGALLTSGLTL